MTTKTRMTLAALALVATTALPATTAFAGEKPGVVIQMSEADPAKWHLALNNANNLVTAMGGAQAVDVEIVAYGPGLAMLKEDSPVSERLGVAISDGVKLAACGNTMKKMKVSEGDLALGVTVVQAGVKEIVDRQRAGWSYVRP